MKARAVYSDGIRCQICGIILHPPSLGDPKGAIIDHVYPKSIISEISVYQQTCAACNFLKSNHAPTAILYRCIKAVRYCQEIFPNTLHPSLRVEEKTPIDVKYILSFPNMVDLEVSYSCAEARYAKATRQYSDSILFRKVIEHLGSYIIGEVGIEGIPNID